MYFVQLKYKFHNRTNERTIAFMCLEQTDGSNAAFRVSMPAIKKRPGRPIKGLNNWIKTKQIVIMNGFAMCYNAQQ